MWTMSCGGKCYIKKDPFDLNASLWHRLHVTVQAGEKCIFLAAEQIPLSGSPSGESTLVLTSQLRQQTGQRGRHVHGMT